MKKVLKYDSSYQVITGDGIEILDTLPAGMYELKAAKNRGFWFEKMALEKFEGKVYGDQDRITNKVVSRYDSTSGRNLGILLSGKKGTGKSLFAKNLAVRMSETIPVIVIKENYGSGMLSTIADIQGKAMVVFDEFEKMFRSEADGANGEDDIREQEKALSFFDGVEVRQEKLLVLTVNDPTSLSKYLLGRPGRIYYHFRMGVPMIDEISDYLKDNLRGSTKSDRQALSSRLAAMGLSWDSLSAVVGELNFGASVDETLRDLNLRTDTVRDVYNVKAEYEDGVTDSTKVSSLDMFGAPEDQEIHLIFDRHVAKSRFNVDHIWTKVKFVVENVKAGAGLKYFVEKFGQEPPEDSDDNVVEGAPVIKAIYIEKCRSTEDMMYSAYRRGGLSLL